MPRKRESRLYTRQRGGKARYYADLRDYADVGGRQEALIADGESSATTDPATAEVLLGRRIEALEEKRRARTVLRITRPEETLEGFASHHLVEKKRSGRVTDAYLEDAEMHLRRTVTFFGASRGLDTIGTSDVMAWVAQLQATPNGRGGTLSGGTVRHHLNILSNLYRRAQSEGCVRPGYNPVAALLEKPSARREEARWLEVHEAAVLLEAARTYRSPKPELAAPFAYELVATLLLTGGRWSEVRGLEVADVSFDRRAVTFRPNCWRRVKTAMSHRTVPLWPQLEEILRPYVFGAERPPGRLLFPSLATGEEAMLVDARKMLDGIAERAGWARGEIRSKIFRHTYTAARLQTLDHGAPVSLFTVSKELGHGGESMVRRVYGHLGTVRHRTDVVEYRVNDFLAQEIRDGQTVEELLRSLNA